MEKQGIHQAKLEEDGVVSYLPTLPLYLVDLLYTILVARLLGCLFI